MTDDFLDEKVVGFAGGGGSDSWGGDVRDGDSWNSSSTFDDGWSNGVNKDTSINKHISSGMLLLFLVVLFVGLLINKRRHNSSVYKAPPLTPGERAQLMASLSESDHNDTEQEKWIHEEAEKIFVAYQNDWSNFKLENIKKYTTERYFEHVKLMLMAIRKMGRRNVVSDLKVIKVSLLSELNGALPIRISLQFKFSGVDTLIDSSSNKVLYHDRVYAAFEIWSFIYDGTSLKLDEVKRPTESGAHSVEDLAKFAEKNGLFYSLDWGRYVLPARGLIFEKSNFRESDINNYIVGEWGQCLIQLYTYSSMPDDSNRYYLVGQISVPKKYGGIIIISKMAKLESIVIPKHYEKFELEWEEFNQRYDVYAEKKDALLAFELLNPKFMTEIYDRNLDYNIEVIDNTIYIFAKIIGTNKTQYVELLDILSQAFKELKA